MLTLPFTLPTSDLTLMPAWGPLVHVDDHCADGLTRLLEQFKDKPRLTSVICSHLDQVQELEDAAWDVLILRTLTYALGEQLDVLGELLAQPRAGYPDEPYRSILRAKVRVLRSRGRPDELLLITLLILGDRTAPVGLTELFPAALAIVPDVVVEDPVLMIGLLRKAVDAGVRLLLEWTGVEPDDAFTLSSSDTVETSTTQGLGDIADATTGGELAGVIE